MRLPFSFTPFIVTSLTRRRPAGTTRDFAVLKRLFSHLKVDLVELAQLEREAKAQDDLENRVELDHFAFERSFDEGHVLSRALKLFEERTGRSAFRVQQECVLLTLSLALSSTS